MRRDLTTRVVAAACIAARCDNLTAVMRGFIVSVSNDYCQQSVKILGDTDIRRREETSIRPLGESWLPW